MQTQSVTSHGGLIVDGSIVNSLTTGNLAATSIQANTITADIAYSSTRIRQILLEKIEQVQKDANTPYTDDEWEAGHADGYNLGLVDGLLMALDTLEKPLDKFKRR